MICALDATHSISRDPSGVALYCSRIIQEVARAAPEDRFLLCYRANRFFRAFSSPLPSSNCSRRLMEDFAPFRAPRSDLFHGLNQRLPRAFSKRTIATFHDLFVLTGDYSTLEFRQRFAAFARETASRCDHVIAISQFTADQVVSHLNYPRERITVVHHGVDPVPEFAASELSVFRRGLGLEDPFVLHVGAIQARKNISRLVDAFEGLPEKYLLVLAGSAGYGAQEIISRVAKSSARGRVRLLGYVGREELNRLYRCASVLAFPSLEEGFGFPVIEAMSAGLPVVTSDGSALREVAGDAAVLVNPLDVEELRGGLLRALEDQTLRARLVVAGRESAAGFSWALAGKKTLEVYRRVV